MLPNPKIVFGKLFYFFAHMAYQRIPIRNQPLCLIFYLLQLIANFKLQMEDRTLQRDPVFARFSFVHSEKFKIPTEIKNIKFIFVLSIKQTRTQSRSTPDHLPELRLAHYLFKENEVHNLRHINSGIQHINRNGDLRKFFRV